MTVNLSLQQRGTQWFIHGLDDGDLGPYTTKGDAESDRRGIVRFCRYEMPDATSVHIALPEPEPLPEPIRDPGKQLCLF